MKHPQSLAEKLDTHFPNETLYKIKKYGCCAWVLMWCLGLKYDDTEAVMKVAELMKNKALDQNCTVYWFEAVRQLTGKELKGFEKVNITSIKNIKERTPVLYKKNKDDDEGHWVGVEKGKIAFNPKETSVCVSKGKPYEMRKLTY